MAETFATALHTALERRQVSLSALRDRLAARGHQISLATLSYWRSGQRVPTHQESLDALEEVEALLDVPEGSLAVLAAEARRHQRRTTVPFDTLVLGTAVGELRGEHDLERVLFHMTVDVDRAGQAFTSTVTQVFAALRDDVAGVTMFVGPDPDGVTNSSAIEAVSGCRIGAVEDRPDGIRSVRLEFESPVCVGESVLTQTRVTDAGPHVADETEYGIVAEQRHEECLLLVRFRPDEVPARCWVGYQEGDVEAEWEVDLAGRTSTHYRLTDFGPGVCRARWEW